MPKLIAYWIVTALVAGVYLFGGFIDILQPADFLNEVGKLGYPLYFFKILGVWKISAGLVILLPNLPRLKEWAYAGMLFNLTGAFASHLFVNDTSEAFVPLIVLGLAIASFVLRPAERRLPGPVF